MDGVNMPTTNGIIIILILIVSIVLISFVLSAVYYIRDCIDNKNKKIIVKENKKEVKENVTITNEVKK